MRNENWIICYDFETDGKDPNVCNPVQLAAVPIHPETLEIVKDQAFDVIIRPPGIDKDEYFTDAVNATIQWHANNYKCSFEEIVEKWKGGVAQKVAWKNFCQYCKKYNIEKSRRNWYPAPIPAGYNITGYDAIIVDRLNKKHKTPSPFAAVRKLDAMDMLFWWLENLPEPHNYSMDTMRDFFGMAKAGVAHDALQDVYDEAELITRFMKFHRKQARVDKFKGSFSC